MCQKPVQFRQRPHRNENECVREGEGGIEGESKQGVVQTQLSLLCEMFHHLPGLALQMALG